MVLTRKKLRAMAGIWAPLLILATVASLTYRSIDRAVDTLGWVEHTNLTLREIADMNGAYSRASSARRAYVIAGDESQLADVRDLDSRLAQAIAAIRLSLSDNAPQVARLEALTGLLKERLDGLDASVIRRRTDGVGVETANGLALTARIRTLREEMEAVENRLLARRDEDTRREMLTTKVAEAAGTLVSLTILLFVFRRMREEIGRRERSELALRSSESFLDSIVENLPDMIFVKDAAELRFERINRAGEELLGRDRKDLIHKNDFDFFPKAEAEAFQARDLATLESKVILDTLEERLHTKHGERWVHTKKVPVLDEHGTPRYLLGISEDITERREAAEALRVAKDSAEAANKELEAFSYSVAHDLRAPLRAIHGFALAIEEDCSEKLDTTGLDYLKRVRSAAARMGELIDGLLSLSRLTRADFVRSRVDLSQLARQCAERLRELDRERQVEIVIADGLAAYGDERLLLSLFDNLLGNAWKFTGKTPSARVEIGQHTTEGRTAYFVRDNGAGFDQTYAHKLFGAFQRLHATSDFDGSGIGLATVQSVVRRHGGRVWAEGKVGAGATFYFTL